MTRMTDDEIDRLGHAIAVAGPGAHEDEIAALAGLAASAGASATVVEVLSDATAPDVVRGRAYAAAVAALRRCRGEQGWVLAA